METSRRGFVGGAVSAGIAPALPAIAAPANQPRAQVLAADIAARRMSALEAVDAAIARIQAGDIVTNAIVVRDFDRARDAARRADSVLARGERAPLLGVPITVKESFDVAGLPTSWGMPQFAHAIARSDAAAVARLRGAGAIVLGKSNLHFQMGLFHGARVPLLLHDWQSFNPLYGTSRNPWDPSRTPGGSSGGAAAALAAGYIALELGSDIGGSIRAPAHFCGVYGHKPSSGIVSGDGHDPPGMSGPPPPFAFFDMAVYGPMARSANDLRLALPILASPMRLPAARATRLREFRVFMLDDHPLMPVSSDVRMLMEAQAQVIENAGATITRRSSDLPDLAKSARAYMQALSAFDALAWPSSVLPILNDATARLASHDDSLAANRLRGAVLSQAGLADLASYRSALRAEWRRFFEQFDVLLCPIMPTAAFHHDHSEDQERRRIVIDGRSHPYMDQLFWPGVATFPGLPATAVPIGLTPGALPVGMQIIGPALGDMTCIAFAALIEQAFGRTATA